MESEGPYFIDKDGYITGPTGKHDFVTLDTLKVFNSVFECGKSEGRKSAEKELEEKKAVKDALLCGTGFMKDGKRVPPEDVYLSDAEIKLKKAEKDFEELLMHANAMAFCSPSAIYLEFLDWKRARGIE